MRESIIKAAKDLGVTLLPNEEIKPGDLYLAERHTGSKLLTCRVVNKENGWVGAVEKSYPYDINECFKVKA